MTDSKFPRVDLISNDTAPLADDELAAASGGTSLFGPVLAGPIEQVLGGKLQLPSLVPSAPGAQGCTMANNWAEASTNVRRSN